MFSLVGPSAVASTNIMLIGIFLQKFYTWSVSFPSDSDCALNTPMSNVEQMGDAISI